MFKNRSNFHCFGGEHLSKELDCILYLNWQHHARKNIKSFPKVNWINTKLCSAFCQGMVWEKLFGN
jgi:hypothetical protein